MSPTTDVLAGFSSAISIQFCKAGLKPYNRGNSVAPMNLVDKAAAAFKKQQQQREDRTAQAEYRAAVAKEENKIEKLRALRLARDAEVGSAKDAKPRNPAFSLGQENDLTETKFRRSDRVSFESNTG